MTVIFRIMSLRLLSCLCLALLLPRLAQAGPQAGPQPVLQPTSVEMAAEPGVRQRQILTLSNPDGDETLSLTIGLADWTLTPDGQVILAPPGESEASAAEWARFSPAFVTLPPGASRTVIVDIITPAKLPRSGDYRFALLASAIMPDTETGLMRKIEQAGLFYLTAAPARSEPAVRDIQLVERGDGARALRLRIENNGNAHARLEGEVRITGQGEPVSWPVSNLVVLDGVSREFTIPLDRPLPQRATVTTDFRNIFAPQSASEALPVRTYSAPLQTSVSTDSPAP